MFLQIAAQPPADLPTLEARIPHNSGGWLRGPARVEPGGRRIELRHRSLPATATALLSTTPAAVEEPRREGAQRVQLTIEGVGTARCAVLHLETEPRGPNPRGEYACVLPVQRHTLRLNVSVQHGPAIAVWAMDLFAADLVRRIGRSVAGQGGDGPGSPELSGFQPFPTGR